MFIKSKATTIQTFLITLGVFCGAGLVPNAALASPILRSGDTVSVEANQVLENDFYGLGGSVTISGEAKKDVYVAGGSVTENAAVDNDLVVAGGTVQIHSDVKGSVRVIGGTAIIANHVEGDLVVMGGTVTVLSTASVSGDVLFLGGSMTIEGEVHGSVVGSAEQIRINAPVGGDVKIYQTQTLTLGDQANIAGSLTYVSTNDMTRAQNATVKGAITKNTIPPEPLSDSLRNAFSKILIVLFAALSCFLFLRPALIEFTEDILATYGKQGLVGFFGFIGLPFLAFILILSVLGSLVGFLVLIGYLLLLIVAIPISGIVLGGILFKFFGKGVQINLGSAVLGTIVLCLLAFIPLIGPLVVFLVFFIVFGGILLRIYYLFR